MRLVWASTVVAAAFAATIAVRPLAQARDGFVEPFDHPAIDYYNAPLADPVSRLEKDLSDGRND